MSEDEMRILIEQIDYDIFFLLHHIIVADWFLL